MLGMCETNALKAYRHTVGPMTRFAWLVKLSDSLINNPYLEEGAVIGDDDEAGPSGAGGSSGRCDNLVYTTFTSKC